MISYRKYKDQKSNKIISRLTISTILILLILYTSLATYIVYMKCFSAPNTNYEQVNNYISLLNELKIENIKAHASKLVSFKTRVIGYPGYYASTQYIISQLKSYGLTVILHTYNAAMPIDEGSWILVRTPEQTINITAYALWPNGGVVAPIVRNITGTLYYVPDCSLSSLKGIPLNDAIILTEFNTGSQWLNLAKLGAKAVVFIEPPSTDIHEAIAKISRGLLNFPRLYVNATAGGLLRKFHGQKITLYSIVHWKEVTAYNIIGILNGTSSEDILILSTYYDSWSVVPTLSPDAEGAVNPSVLLEIARCLSKIKPVYTIWFTFYSGSWEGMIGPMEFVEKYVLNTDKRIWLQLGMDLSSESYKVDLLYLGMIFGGAVQTIYAQSFANSPQFVAKLKSIESIFRSKLDSINSEKAKNLLGVNEDIKDLISYHLRGEMWWGTQPINYLLFTEALIPTGGISVCLRTQYARRNSWFTPLNTYTRINWRNIRIQAMLFLLLSYKLSSEKLNLDWSSIQPKRYSVTTTAIYGYATLRGKTVEFSSKTGWYDSVPHALVRRYLISPDVVFLWPFVFQYKMSNVHGDFIFYGLVPYQSATFDAWKFNETTGDITYALDYGYYGTAQGVSGGIRNVAYPLTAECSIMIPLFRCIPITLFDLFDIRRMQRYAIQDLRIPHTFLLKQPSIEVLTKETKGAPIFYGFYPSPDGVGTVFVRKGERVMILFNPDPSKYSRPQIIIVNSTYKDPEGEGILAIRPMILHNTLLLATKDLYNLVMHRYGNMRNFLIKSTFIENSLNNTFNHLKAAETQLSLNNYEAYYKHILTALLYISKAYQDMLMPSYNEISLSASLFYLLMLIASVFFEKLLFRGYGFTKIFNILIILALLFTCYYFVHPAMSLMANSVMSVFGVAMLLLMLFITSIISSDIRRTLAEYVVRRLGFHEFKTEKISAIVHTLGTAVENLRHRPLLTILAFSTIIIYAVAQTSFTSLTYTYGVMESRVETVPPYNGILIKQLYGFPPEATRGGVLDMPLIQYLKLISGENYTISPRIWLYPVSSYPQGVSVHVISLENPNNKMLLSPIVFLGLTSEEIKHLFKDAIYGFSSFSGEYQCIVPENVAKTLNLSIGDRIYVQGLDINLTVTGIMILTASDIVDFDNRYMLPVDPMFSWDLCLLSGYTVPEYEPTPLSVNNIIIIPWETAYKLGGFISSVSIIPIKNDTQSQIELARMIAYLLDYTVYSGFGNSNTAFYRMFMYELLGWNFSLIILIIASLSILNFMLASITARKREIYIYSAVGVSPTGIFLMYITEAIAMVSGGIILGYLIGFGLNKFFLSTCILPSNFSFNFSSTSVTLSLIITVLITISSAIYPAIIASKIVTPSLERRWKIPTKPRGDLWEIPLPFKLPEAEALGAIRYLAEYYSGIGAVRAGFRVSEVNLAPLRGELILKVVLTPIELNTRQEAVLKVIREDNICSFKLIIKRLSGEKMYWVGRNYLFVDSIRKQLLLWRSLPLSERVRYLKEEYNNKANSI